MLNSQMNFPGTAHGLGITIANITINTLLNVVPVNGDVAIPIIPRLFVVKAKSMHNLVNGDPRSFTTTAKTDFLFSTCAANM